MVGLAPSNHGTTTLSGLFTLAEYLPGASAFTGALCPACEQQAAGSPFITELNSGGETVPGVAYTVIESRYDEVVTPTPRPSSLAQTSPTSGSRTSAYSISASTSRCPTTTSPTPMS